jgi:hypothetical protein
MFISIYTILIIGKYHIDIYNFYRYSESSFDSMSTNGKQLRSIACTHTILQSSF